MDLAALLALLDRIAELTSEELTQLRTDLATAAGERAELTTAEAVAELEQIADALDRVTARETELATEAADRTARAQAALDRVKAATEPEPDPVVPDPDAPVVPDPEGTLEPVAAGATTKPVISRVAVRRPAATAPRTSAEADAPPKWGLTASANVDGMAHGQAIDDVATLGKAFGRVIEATRGWNKGRTEIIVASRTAEYPESRYLGRDFARNAEVIESVTSLQAITAAGGICAPTQIKYDLPTLGTDARPVRDQMLARFGADRGGVTLFPPPVLSQVTGGISTWTHANDLNPSDPATKPCLTVTCPEPEESLVDAIVECLRFGNYRARYFGEQIKAWTALLDVAQARHAETKLLTAIGAGSTQVTTGQLLGSSRDVYASVERVAVAFRSRHRLPENFPMRFGAPFWLKANMRTDLLRELPGSAEERMAVADAKLEEWFRVRSIVPTWFLDGESGQVFGAQPDGHALPWPTTVVTYLYPEGSWLFLDGGQLDLGIVRDSALNSTNDVQMFAETFEGLAFNGVESYRLTMDICPNGWTSGTVDINPCTTGS